MDEVLRLHISRYGPGMMQTRVLESPLGEPCDVVPLPVATIMLLDMWGPSIGPIGTDPGGPTTCETGQVTVWAQITDDSGVARADLEYLFIPAGGVGMLASQPMSVDGSTFYTTLTGLGVGELRLNIRAWDTLGNETYSDKVTLVITLC